MSRRNALLALNTLTAAGLLLALALLPTVSRAATLPAQFADQLVASVGSPTALAFTPDGRLLITTQGGQLRVVQNGSLLATPALSLGSRLCTNSERGLLGIAIHPSFAANGYIYVYYTFNKGGSCPTSNTTTPVNRVSRFTLSAANVVDPASEVVLIDNIMSFNANHNAGDLHFGKDGLLYISVGDGGCDYAGSGCAGSNDAARETHTLLGKILRVEDDGEIPSTNPYRGTDSARCNVNGRTDPGKHCQETFASGLRNPFRIAFDPNAATTRFFINDVGQNTWEEIDQGVSGADYGWNTREGFCANGSTTNCRSAPGAVVGGLTDPLHAYGRSVGYSITGGAFVPNGVWPATYDGDYLFGDYGGKIMRLEAGGGGSWTRSDFVTGLGNSSVVNMVFGPSGSTQALYYTTYASGGQIRRIVYSGATNRPPTAALSASPTSGAAPLAVSFSGAGSSDPDSDALTYVWTFGDGSAARETSAATTSYTYAAAGTYTASLVVRDSKGATSAPVTQRIDAGNTAPTATITSPSADTLFYVGQTLTLTATASDPQDGPLPAGQLSWRVLQHHNDHTHPYLLPTTGNDLTIVAPQPEDLQATTTSYLEIELTVTDSQGLTTVVRRNVLPKMVDVTLATQPAGLRINVNGFALTGPTTIKSWERYRLDVSAPAQTGTDGQPYEWASWSDGGAQAHSIVTPATASSYSATFRAVSSGGGLLGEYYDNRDFSAYRAARVDSGVNFDWANGTPAGSGLTGADTYSVRWTGSVKPRYSQTYTFYTSSDDGVRLWVNGQQVVNNWTDHGRAENSGTIALVAGQSYAIRLEYYENTGYSIMQLLWSSASQAKEVVPAGQLAPPAPSNNGTGLHGEYFDNTNLTTSRTVRTDAGVNFDWGSGTPAGTALTSGDTFSVRWTGSVEAPVAGAYTFTTSSDDGVRLWVCGTLLVDNWTDHSPADNSATIALGAGQRCAVRMEYYENGGGAVARLSWAYAGQARQIIPAARLHP